MQGECLREDFNPLKKYTSYGKEGTAGFTEVECNQVGVNRKVLIGLHKGLGDLVSLSISVKSPLIHYDLVLIQDEPYYCKAIVPKISIAFSSLATFRAWLMANKEIVGKRLQILSPTSFGMKARIQNSIATAGEIA
ncbi:hypothetical protein H4Q26_004883 [Puccinia striiformis f. sp. tritici PST-130]|nr:hypothetical protein H4Q26_004883 [Puccinia striiformis f. sp. tritici PST-130]